MEPQVKSIGVVGNGVVGAATATAFNRLTFLYKVRIHDRDPERTAHSLAEVLACDIVFVCLPTPQERGGLACDTSALDEFFGSIRHNGGCDETNLVLRSTVPIGYTAGAAKNHALPNLVHWPEFLTARTAARDALRPVRNVVGYVRTPCALGEARYKLGCYETHPLRSLLLRRFSAVPLFELTSDESEAVKLMQNGFSAVKIAFFNEMRRLADRKGLDWDDVLGALLAGGWINPMHTEVPGPDGKRGFGGSCLPKDLASLVQQLWDARTEDELLAGTSVCGAAHYRNLFIDRRLGRKEGYK